MKISRYSFKRYSTLNVIVTIKRLSFCILSISKRANTSSSSLISFSYVFDEATIVDFVIPSSQAICSKVERTKVSFNSQTCPIGHLPIIFGAFSNVYLLKASRIIALSNLSIPYGQLCALLQPLCYL